MEKFQIEIFSGIQYLMCELRQCWPGPKGHLGTLKSIIFFKFYVDTLLHISISTHKNDLGNFTNDKVLFLYGTNQTHKIFFWISLPCIKMYRDIHVKNKCGGKHGAKQSYQTVTGGKASEEKCFGKKLKLRALTLTVERLNGSLGTQSLSME